MNWILEFSNFHRLSLSVVYDYWIIGISSIQILWNSMKDSNSNSSAFSASRWWERLDWGQNIVIINFLRLKTEVNQLSTDVYPVTMTTICICIRQHFSTDMEYGMFLLWKSIHPALFCSFEAKGAWSKENIPNRIFHYFKNMMNIIKIHNMLSSTLRKKNSKFHWKFTAFLAKV